MAKCDGMSCANLTSSSRKKKFSPQIACLALSYCRTQIASFTSKGNRRQRNVKYKKCIKAFSKMWGREVTVLDCCSLQSIFTFIHRLILKAHPNQDLDMEHHSGNQDAWKVADAPDSQIPRLHSVFFLPPQSCTFAFL